MDMHHSSAFTEECERPKLVTSAPKGTRLQMNPWTGPGAILDASQVIWGRLGIHLEVPE